MKRLLFFILSLAAATLLTGQPVGEEALLLQLQQEDFNQINALYLQQSGEANTVSIRQVEPQYTQIRQDGRENTALVAVQGQNNGLFVHQSGEKNRYDLSLQGTGNRLLLIQNGYGNEVTQHLTDFEGLLLGLVQVGNENEIHHTESGLDGTGVPLIIRQKGDGIKVNITTLKDYYQP